MTESEAIEILKGKFPKWSYEGIYRDEDKYEYEMAQLAIKALEKQISMKPKTNRVDLETTYCKCPSCNITTVLYRNCIMNYCKECGQKLDWSDGNDD